MASARPADGIYTHSFDNGLHLVFEPMPWLPSVSLTFLVPAGSVTDPDGREGSMNVLHDWLSRGAGALSSQEFSNALDDLGVRRGGSAGREFSTFSASCLVVSLPETLRLLAALLTAPNLAEEEFASAHQLVKQELASLQDNPTQLLIEALMRSYFASGHGRSAYGTVEGLANLTAEEVRRDYRRRFGPQGVVLGVAGGVSWEELRDAVSGNFQEWRGKGVTVPPVRTNPPRREHLETTAAQVQIGLAFEALSADDPHWYHQLLAIQVLSGGSGSRLFIEVREKRGLVYSVAAVVRVFRNFGYLLGYAGTTPERAADTLAIMLDEITALRSGVSEDELERARTGILSQLIMQGEATGARASALAQDTFLRGRPRPTREIRERIEAVDLAAINEFLQAMPEPQPTVVSLGPRSPLEGPTGE